MVEQANRAETGNMGLIEDKAMAAGTRNCSMKKN